jgi:hypothetical protein
VIHFNREWRSEELQDQVLGFATVTTKQLLHHLDTNYGTISFKDLARNLENCDDSG